MFQLQRKPFQLSEIDFFFTVYNFLDQYNSQQISKIYRMQKLSGTQKIIMLRDPEANAQKFLKVIMST